MRHFLVFILAAILAAATFPANTSAAPAVVTPTATNAAEGDIAKFDLNKVNLEELISIRGIGPTIANLILELRAQKGTFASVDELLEVKGVGEKNLSHFKERFYIPPSSPQAASEILSSK